ncbi:hypothetical protein MTO96_013933 [Rhipicephalus appendiculatus]
MSVVADRVCAAVSEVAAVLGRPHGRRPRGRAAAGGRPDSAAEPRALRAAAVSYSALRPLDCAVRSAALCLFSPSTSVAAPRVHVTHQCSGRRATTAAVDVRPTSKMALEKPAHQRPPGEATTANGRR